ncbi:SAM-dependent methyltransferase [Candidatus Pelagibacter bacterium]|nr:SAM-dependent methyltransferase [Candidatus Pelagibacter bacterium]
MKIKKNKLISLDKFIDDSLYNEKFGYYMKKNPFGSKGDFITAPNISILFSEMIAIWIISFWKNLKCPTKFNLVELGAGNGDMMKVLINTFHKFPEFDNACNINILEKSKLLKSLQKKNINNKKVIWLRNLDELDKKPSIFVANEFFDALPIKQFIKKKNKWYERHVNLDYPKKLKYQDIPFNIKELEKKIKFKISDKQNFIEYSPIGIEYLKNVLNKVKLNDGGFLIIDYGYTEKKIKNTLQAVSNHMYSNVLDSYGKSDITHNISFDLFNKIIKKLGSLSAVTTKQRHFLTKLGIFERAEIISKNIPFSKKTDIFYRIKRLIDKDQMGDLFKVLFITKKENKFTLGF